MVVQNSTKSSVILLKKDGTGNKLIKVSVNGVVDVLDLLNQQVLFFVRDSEVEK